MNLSEYKKRVAELEAQRVKLDDEFIASILDNNAVHFGDVFRITEPKYKFGETAYIPGANPDETISYEAVVCHMELDKDLGKVGLIRLSKLENGELTYHRSSITGESLGYLKKCHILSSDRKHEEYIRHIDLPANLCVVSYEDLSELS